MPLPTVYADEQQRIIRATIRWYMDVYSLSNNEVAEKMGIEPQSVRNYLNSAHISRKTLERFAKALDCSPLDLCLGETYPPNVISDIKGRLQKLEDAVFGKGEQDE